MAFEAQKLFPFWRLPWFSLQVLRAHRIKLENMGRVGTSGMEVTGLSRMLFSPETWWQKVIKKVSQTWWRRNGCDSSTWVLARISGNFNWWKLKWKRCSKDIWPLGHSMFRRSHVTSDEWDCSQPLWWSVTAYVTALGQHMKHAGLYCRIVSKCESGQWKWSIGFWDPVKTRLCLPATIEMCKTCIYILSFKVVVSNVPITFHDLSRQSTLW